jgi:hypothetical protein
VNLQKIPTAELRAELSRRQKIEQDQYEAAVKAAHPCPECGADPVLIATDAVEEHRFAPRDHDGRPMIFMPYESEMGTTGGLTYETTVTCENGHVTTKRDVRWFDKPRQGPPILPRH